MTARARLPEDAEIADARAESSRQRYERRKRLRGFADTLIDGIEETIRRASDEAGVTEAEEFLDYVAGMIATRLLERKLTP